jgi:TPP-dependent indolepyruvate ferredoxin oxidoreductase alpha subunit
VGVAPAWAVTGDFGFAAAGHLGLLEARHRALPLKVVLLGNGTARATGGQPVPPRALDTLLAGYSACTIRLDAPTNPARCRAALAEAADREELAIVWADYT